MLIFIVLNGLFFFQFHFNIHFYSFNVTKRVKKNYNLIKNRFELKTFRIFVYCESKLT